MHKHTHSSTDQCEVDMTPMIDVVFQLIIFFVVTLKMTTEQNEKIVLENGKHGETITNKNRPPTTLEIELDRKRYWPGLGSCNRISIGNVTFTKAELRDVLKYRVNRLGAEFPVLIRADRATTHDKVKEIMDICTGAGIWKLSFVALKEDKSGLR